MSNSMTFHINSNLFRTVQHLSLFDCKENMEKRKPFISYNLAKQLLLCSTYCVVYLVCKFIIDLCKANINEFILRTCQKTSDAFQLENQKELFQQTQNIHIPHKTNTILINYIYSSKTLYFLYLISCDILNPSLESFH